ncbi:PREDICTED: uncharacterized protein LOC108530707 [Rhinopithecus bieti]|uniref:uncharacterized protein LOC108530707 n=1 Tax=Rhinopithecus bieti TaxID=61621 RepID=UPI00083C6BC0|nr:PREDICTED: uncharacterized protein LOC108530707 [Rhinopithecus bieti]
MQGFERNKRILHPLVSVLQMENLLSGRTVKSVPRPSSPPKNNWFLPSEEDVLSPPEVVSAWIPKRLRIRRCDLPHSEEPRPSRCMKQLIAPQTLRISSLARVTLRSCPLFCSSVFTQGILAGWFPGQMFLIHTCGPQETKGDLHRHGLDFLSTNAHEMWKLKEHPHQDHTLKQAGQGRETPSHHDEAEMLRPPRPLCSRGGVILLCLLPALSEVCEGRGQCSKELALPQRRGWNVRGHMKAVTLPTF